MAADPADPLATNWTKAASFTGAVNPIVNNTGQCDNSAPPLSSTSVFVTSRTLVGCTDLLIRGSANPIRNPLGVGSSSYLCHFVLTLAHSDDL